MYSVSNKYEVAIKEPSRIFKSKAIIKDYVYTNDNIVSLILDTVQAKEGYPIGNTVSRSLELTILSNDDFVLSTFNVNLSIGLELEDGAVEYIQQGIFNIDDVEKTDYTIKYTCYDNMVKFETPFFTDKNTCTISEAISILSTRTGIAFAGTIENNYIVDISQVNGCTCREVLGYISALEGGNAYINREGKFTIASINNLSYSINAENYITYIREDKEYKISKLSCQLPQKDDSNKQIILEVGTNDYMDLQFENPLMTQTILNNIYNKLNNVSFLGYSMKWQGDLSLDPMDVISCTDVKGVTRKLFIFSQKLTYNGGLTSEIGAKGQTESSNSFSSSGNTANKVNRLVTEQAVIKEALINKANIQDLQATNGEIENLKTYKADVKDLTAINAEITDLKASDATIIDLVATKAEITDLNAANGKITILESNVADIETLVNGNITSDNIQSLILSSDKVTVENGFIKNAMIDNLDVSKINAGTISTDKFNITSDNGAISIVGATQQFKDNNGNVRVQIGKDASGNFTFIVKAADGSTTLIDGTGVKAGAISDGLIVDKMVSSKANIDGSKLNISSIVNSINNGTTLLKGTKIQLDKEGQTLEAAFNTLKTTTDKVKETTESNTTSITAIQGDIKTLISNTTITKDKTTVQLKDAYSKLEQTVSGINSTVGSHTTSISTINANITNAQNIANNANSLADSKAKVFTVTPTTPYKVGDLWVQGTSGDVMKCKTTRSTGSYTASDWVKASKYTDDTKANAVATDVITLAGRVTTTESNYTSLIQDLSGFKTTVGNTYSTKTELSTVDGKVTSINTRLSTAESGITQLNNKISLKVEKTDIDTAIGSLELGGVNLLVQKTITKGKFLNALGVETTQGLWFYSDYINVTGMKNLVVSGYSSLGLNPSVCYYDSNKTFVKGIRNNNQNIGKLITIDEGISFIRFSGLMADLPTLKIEKGTKATSYSPAPEDLKSYSDTKVSVVEAKITDEAFTVQIDKNKNRTYGVRYIRDFIGQADTTKGYEYASPMWMEIEVFNSKGVNVAKGCKVILQSGKTAYTSTSTVNDEYFGEGFSYTDMSGVNYITLDLGSVMYDIDSIKVWHGFLNSGVTDIKLVGVFNNTKTQISVDNTNWTTLFDSSISGTYGEFYAGNEVKVNSRYLNTMQGSFTEEGLKILNGSIEVYNGLNDKVMWVDTNGKLTANSLKVHGDGGNTVHFTGKGEKYIVLESNDSKSVFVKFQTGNSICRIGTYSSRTNGEIFIEPGKYEAGSSSISTVIFRGINSTTSVNAICNLEVYGKVTTTGNVIANGIVESRAKRCTISPNIDLFEVVQKSAGGYFLKTALYDGITPELGIDMWVSDMMLKTDFDYTSINALEKIMKIEHATYSYKDYNSKIECGYIGQQIELVQSEWVNKVTQEDGTYIVQPSASGIIPYITKAIQEQQTIIENLKKEIEDLKGTTE